MNDNNNEISDKFSDDIDPETGNFKNHYDRDTMPEHDRNDNDEFTTTSAEAQEDERTRLSKSISLLFEEFRSSDSEERKAELTKYWQEVKQFIEDNLEGEDRVTALGYLVKCPATDPIIVSNIRATNRRLTEEEFIIELRAMFPEIVPNSLVDYMHEYEKTYRLASDGHPHFSFQHEGYGLEREFAKIRLTELLTGQKILEDLEDVPDSLFQNDLPPYYHGLNADKLEEVLQNGLLSSRSLSSGGRPLHESAFPAQISFCRPLAWYKEKGYHDTYTRKADYGASLNSDGRGLGKITLIVDFDYILPRSFSASRVNDHGYLTVIDEFESTDSIIPADKISGIICECGATPSFFSPESEEWLAKYHDDFEQEYDKYKPTEEMVKERDRVIELVKKSGRKIKVYSVDGALLYPEKKSPGRVAAEYRARVLDKLKPQTTQENP